MPDIVLTPYNRECLLPVTFSQNLLPEGKCIFIRFIVVQQSIQSKLKTIWECPEPVLLHVFTLLPVSDRCWPGVTPVSSLSLPRVWVIISKSWALFCLDTARRPSAGQPAAADFYLMLEYSGSRDNTGEQGCDMGHLKWEYSAWK